MSDASTLRGALASIIADPDCCAASKAIARDALTYHANSANTEDMSCRLGEACGMASTHTNQNGNRCCDFCHRPIELAGEAL